MMIKNSYKKLEQSLGYRFKKRGLLELALTHPSFRYENAAEPEDNQRLEFLGDAALSLVTAEHLYEVMPEAREGDLSKLRSSLTKDRKLAEIGTQLGLSEYIRLGKGETNSGGATRSSNLADALEAIIGAAWLDGGSKAIRKIFKACFVPEVDNVQSTPMMNNPKGTLQEHAQRHGFSIPAYEMLEAKGPEHQRTFTVQVTVCDKTFKADAGSKRDAERLAAAEALKTLIPPQE